MVPKRIRSAGSKTVRHGEAGTDLLGSPPGAPSGRYLFMTALVTSEPLVSAVIPTHKRSDMLPRAVQSALSQTYREIEVLVVIDGPDAETTQVPGQINGPRMRIIQLDSNLGGGDARNAGVSAAREEWIAFLDDDDEWLPNKIQRQVAMLTSVSCNDPIVSSRFTARTHLGEHVWPSKRRCGYRWRKVISPYQDTLPSAPK